jgi:hypothetical protein
MAEISMENVHQVFNSVPVDEGQRKTIELITERFTKLAEDVLTNVPRCAIRTVVLRRLLEQKMLCVDAITKGGLI